MKSFCEQGKEPSGFKRGEEFLDHRSNYLLSKDNAVPKNKLLVNNRSECSTDENFKLKKHNIVIIVL